MGISIELTIEQIVEGLKKLTPDELEFLLMKDEINKRRNELKAGDYLKLEDLESLKHV